jgi:hypothetical protein
VLFQANSYSQNTQGHNLDHPASKVMDDNKGKPEINNEFQEFGLYASSAQLAII